MKAHGSSDKGPDIESKQQNVCKQHDILVKFTVDRAKFECTMEQSSQ